MLEIEFAFTTSGEEAGEDPFLDSSEVQLMFDHTREQIRQQVERALGTLRCDEHGGAPRVKISGVYSYKSEQFDIQYHVDGCCNMLILKAVQALNH